MKLKEALNKLNSEKFNINYKFINIFRKYVFDKIISDFWYNRE